MGKGMRMSLLREALSEWAIEHEVTLAFLDPSELYDVAIVGVGRRFNDWFVVYDQTRLLDELAAEIEESTDEDDAQREEGDFNPMEQAIEHFDFNIVGGWIGDSTPVFLIKPDDLEEI
jgi:hypothetical protein